jgi:hypothetical protein
MFTHLWKEAFGEGKDLEKCRGQALEYHIVCMSYTLFVCHIWYITKIGQGKNVKGNGGCTLDQQETDQRVTHQLEFFKSMLYVIKINF